MATQPTSILKDIFGSASPDLPRQSSESLAGRISIITMRGFNLAEVGVAAQNQIWGQLILINFQAHRLERTCAVK